MKEALRSIFLLCIVIQFAGCAGFLKAYHWGEAPLAEHWQAMALECEKSGELQKALISWKVVSELNPEDQQSKRSIARLKTEIKRTSERHFKRAVAAYKKGSLETARKEFLTTLRYNPSHQKALDYLKSKMTWENYTTYKVKKDDTIEDIAGKVYKDPGKDFLVAYFMDLDNTARPEKGAVVRLPVLEPELTVHLMDVSEKLSKAREFFRERDYEKALINIEKVLKQEPENKEANALKNASYYQMGKKLKMKRKYLEALKMFNQVDSNYEDTQEAISAVQKGLKKQADVHYQRGVKHFVNEDLEDAIAEWEEALALNPEHQKARENIENARSLLEKWRQIK